MKESFSYGAVCLLDSEVGSIRGMFLDFLAQWIILEICDRKIRIYPDHPMMDFICSIFYLASNTLF